MLQQLLILIRSLFFEGVQILLFESGSVQINIRTNGMSARVLEFSRTGAHTFTIALHFRVDRLVQSVARFLLIRLDNFVIYRGVQPIPFLFASPPFELFRRRGRRRYVSHGRIVVRRQVVAPAPLSPTPCFLFGDLLILSLTSSFAVSSGLVRTAKPIRISIIMLTGISLRIGTRGLT